MCVCMGRQWLRVPSTFCVLTVAQPTDGELTVGGTLVDELVLRLPQSAGHGPCQTWA